MSIKPPKLDDVFIAAAEIADSDERARYIEQVCGSDVVLRAELEALLEHDCATDSLLDRSAPGIGLTINPPPAEEAGTVIGHYKLLQQIGDGGMGVVYMAEQTEPVVRRVALKIIKPGMDSRQVIARFEAERQALAMMDHPNVSKVLDAGATVTGRPYFVMEFVHGLPITGHCNEHQFTTGERLELFVKVCDAVRHAHQRGIIHRDIKPSNVMVTLRDDEAVPKVIDFGIAKATDQRLTERTVATEQGQLVGTPQYMSPEQADFSTTDVDARTDVYSLGVLLYELLVGTTPFTLQQLRDIGYNRVCQIIRESEPQAPSKRLSTLGDATTEITAQRQTRPADLTRQLRGDLDVIVMKALEKDRKDRYTSVKELADDISRHLRNEPIHARRPTLTSRVLKWSYRHRTFVWAAAAVLLVAVVALSTSTAMIAGALGQARGALAETEVERDNAQTARREAQQDRDEAIKNLYVAQMRMAQKDWDDGQIGRLQKTLLSYLPVPGQEDLRGWEWYYNLSRCHGDLLTWRGHGGGGVNVAWRPDGEHMASGTYNQLKVWSPNTGDVAVTVTGDGGFSGVVWRPDGRRVAAIGLDVDDDRGIKIWDLEQRRMHLRIKPDHHVGFPTWSPNGKHLASAGPDKTVMIWDAETGAEVRKLVGHNTDVKNVAWSPDGKHLAASGHEPGTITIWDTAAGEQTTTLESGQFIFCLDWSPDSVRLAAGTNSGQIFVWDVVSGERVLALTERGPVTMVAWSPDGSQIVTGIKGHTVTLWDSTSGKVSRKLQGHTDNVISLAWSPDGRRLASSGKIVKVWDTVEDRVVRTIAEDAAVGEKVAFSPDDGRLAYITNEQTIKIRDTASGKVVHAMPSPAGIDLSPVWSPDGKRLACGGDDGSIVVYDAENGEEAHSWQHEGVKAPVSTDPDRSVVVSWHPDSRQLASVSEKDAILRIWDAATGSELDSFDTGRLPNGEIRSLRAVAWSPDGERLAIAGWDKSIEIWDRVGRRRLHAMEGAARNFAWSRDSRYLASGDTIWDTFTGRAAQTFDAHAGDVDVAGWSEDGRRFATVSQDGVRFWNPRSGREFFSLPDTKALSWSHDRKRIATVSADGKVRIHDASIGYELAGDPNFLGQCAQDLFNETYSLVEAREFQKATRKRLRAAEIAPHDGSIQSGVAFHLLTCPDQRFRDTAKAAELARRGTELSPELAWGWMVLGIAQYRQNEFKGARTSLLKLVELDPDSDHPRTSCFLAMAYWQLGEKELARQHYNDAVKFIEQNQNEDEVTLRFRDEAAELLGIDVNESERQE